MQKKSPTAAPTRWEYSGRMVHTIIEIKDNLKIFFENLIDYEDAWDGETILQAKGLTYILNDKKFILLLYSGN